MPGAGQARRQSLGTLGWIDLHLYAMVAVALLSGLLLWWTNVSWRGHFEVYPRLLDTLRLARGDVVRGYAVLERHLAGEATVPLADAEALFEQAALRVDDVAKLLSADESFSVGEGTPGVAAALAAYRQGIRSFEGLARQSLTGQAGNRNRQRLEFQAAFAALENAADSLSEDIGRQGASISGRQDRANNLLFFVWLLFLAVLGGSLAMAGARRRKAEKALAESEGKYRSLFDQGMDVILLVDENTGHILDCNLAVTAEWGYACEELAGRTPDSLLLATREAGQATAVEARYADGRRSLVWETRLVTREGAVRDVSVKTSFFTLGGRRVRLEIYRDVTERKKGETKLLEREAMLRGLGDNLPDGVIYSLEVRPDGGRRFLSMSQGVERLFDLPAARVLGDAGLLFDRIEAADREAFRRAEVEAAAGRAAIDIQVRMRAGDGSVRWCQFRAASRRVPEGGVVFDGVLFDVTAQKRTESNLRQAMAEAETASKVKSEFLANISHEVRTPLNGVLGMLQLLEMSPLSEEDAASVATALTCGRGLVKVLADILDFSLIDAGRVALCQDACDIRAVVTDVCGMLSLECGKKGISLFSEVSEAVPPFVATDAARLRQILFNVLGNAVKFTSWGVVRLSIVPASRRGGTLHLLFTVRDTGIGIPEERMDEIFDPFTQIDGSLTRKFGGTGLGLGIVKRLIGLLDGHITVESEPGKGTDFTFSIRCVEAEAPAAEGGPVARHPIAAAAPVRVLVVEDDAINRMATVSMLEKLGFTAEAVEDGDVALDALDGGDFDVVLMDIQMPRLSGDEATRRIRRRERPGLDPEIPIIAVTAHAMDGDQERYLACGMDDYLPKPVDMAALGQAVTRAAARRRALLA
uniref:histidine kinase n=1 Tax=Desulfovibrio sp. U5L TaxID=596152 RepID=I2Q1X5_9BACT